MPADLSAGDTAWVLASAALVLLMTPGLALFYGGMVRAKSVLNMVMMSFASLAVVSVIWVLYGYSLALTGDHGQLIGGFEALGFSGMLGEDSLADTIPSTVFAAFQMMFAIITVALISGAIADRAKFGSWVVFTAIWVTVVYVPVCHWVWGGGWIGETIGALDFAGGTAVHINSGAAALALALVLGKRRGWRREPMRPHNLPMVVIGGALLWFGWFGFNAGSAAAANGTAGVALVNTQVCTAAAIGGWLLVEKLRDGRPTTLGAVSGVVAGLVAITPAADSLTPLGAIILGLIAGGGCALAVSLKTKLGYDDSLDVVGIHLVGGIVGSLFIGLAASATAPAGASGLFTGGGIGLLGRQFVAVLAVAVFSFGMTYAIGKLIDKLMGFRISEEDEEAGIDLAEHAETGYDFSTIGGGSRTGHLTGAANHAPAATAAAAGSATEPGARAEVDGDSDRDQDHEGSVSR